tara:strand:- start:244 stop:486 length:243 start_codon:yes stop_codon:yes gene_type:complete
MLDLAKVISKGKNIEIVGARPGEKTNETLVSEKELPFTYCKDNYVLIFNEKQSKDNNLEKELSSSSAKKMSKEQIDKIIK